MKKDYVSLKVQVIEVQLSDCIAGSGTTNDAVTGISTTSEADGLGGGNKQATFSAW